MTTQHSQTVTPKVPAGTGVHADFKPSISKRKIVYASSEKVNESREAIHTEFAGAFRILAK